MAQWTFIDPNTLLPGAPWTSAKAQASFENLEAVAEGAPGAPRVNGRALDRVYLGAIERVGSTSAIGFSDLDECRGVCLLGSGVWQVPLVSRHMQIRFSNNNGTSFGSYQNFGPDGADFANIVAHVDFISGAWVMQRTNSDIIAETTTGTFSVPLGVNAFQIRVDTAQADRGFGLSAFAIGGGAS